MMNADHTTAQMLLANTLREAEKRRLQNELIREAEAFNQREHQRSVVQRIIQRLRSEQPGQTSLAQEANDAHRIHAV